uniref:Secreted peptide n=1 Tax=Anopheles braziliensis TaxID=58242 RepID=A0A2M3ZME7_9DIPT
MVISILLRTSVILAVMRQTWARPSCMITAATSAFCVTSQAISMRSRAIESHSGFMSVNARFISRSIV